MAKNRKKIPEKVRAILQQEIGSMCPFCENKDVGHFQVHHLDENPENDDLKNLLMLCANCHSKITKKDISPTEVKGVKQTLARYRRLVAAEKSSQTNQFNGPVVQAVFGNRNTININNRPKATKAKYPPGCIGYNIHKSNYVSYLIDRYHEFKEWEIGKKNMRYAIFPSNIKKRYKIGKQRTIYNLPESKFEDLVDYIQSRVDRTALAKLNRSKGQIKNYQFFEEYLEDQSITEFQNP